MQINNKAELDAAIIELEKRKQFQKTLLAEQYRTARESLTPMNLIKDGFNRLTHTAGMQSGLLKTVAGIGIAVLTHKLLPGKSGALLKKVLGGVAEFAVAKSSIMSSL